MPLYQVVMSMMKEPKFIDLEMMNGEIVENLLLYQTTLSDYRVKGYNTHKEYIIPCHNVKSITEDYTFKLKELDNVINEKYLLPLENVTLGINERIVKMFINIVIEKFIHRVWYEKAKIHLKMNELNLSKEALEETLECVKGNKTLYTNFMSLLRTDIELDKVRNEGWFIQLHNQVNEDKLLTS